MVVELEMNLYSRDYRSITSSELEKYQAILHGANGRKFVYTEGGWRLFFTFFPTDKVVDERYALKNKVQMKFHK